MTITLNQLRPLACHTRTHCHTCRSDADWRERVTGVREFDCPHGFTTDGPPSRGLGDTIAKGIKAATGAFIKGGIKPCGGCANRQAKLNKLIPYKK